MGRRKLSVAKVYIIISIICILALSVTYSSWNMSVSTTTNVGTGNYKVTFKDGTYNKEFVKHKKKEIKRCNNSNHGSIFLRESKTFKIKNTGTVVAYLKKVTGEVEGIKIKFPEEILPGETKKGRVIIRSPVFDGSSDDDWSISTQIICIYIQKNLSDIENDGGWKDTLNIDVDASLSITILEPDEDTENNIDTSNEQ